MAGVIRLECTKCGKKLKVGKERAGGVGKCPKCGAAVRIPSPSGQDFEFNCPHCGQRVRGSQTMAGKLFVCPACKKEAKAPTHVPATGTRFSTLARRQAETMLPGYSGGMPGIPGSVLGEFVAPALPIDLGDYTVTDILARGGMGLTFLGFRKGNEQEQVVVKIPSCFDPQVLERFSNETEILSKVEHPNIVRVLSSG